MLQDGLAVAEVSRALGGIPYPTLLEWARQAGVTPPAQHSHLGCEDQALELIGAGVALAEVARRLELSPSTVAFWAREEGALQGALCDRSAELPAHLPQLRKEVLAAIGAGVAAIALSRRYHLPMAVLRAWMEEAGVLPGAAPAPPKPRRPPTPEAPAALKQKSIEYMRAGIPAAVIAKRLGLKAHHLRQWARTAGIPMRRGARPWTLRPRMLPPPPPRIRAVLQSLAAGRSVDEVAAESGLSARAVTYLKQHFLTEIDASLLK